VENGCKNENKEAYADKGLKENQDCGKGKYSLKNAFVFKGKILSFLLKKPAPKKAEYRHCKSCGGKIYASDSEPAESSVYFVSEERQCQQQNEQGSCQIRGSFQNLIAFTERTASGKDDRTNSMNYRRLKNLRHKRVYDRQIAPKQQKSRRAHDNR
jgi:hypothetical protein